MLKRKVIDFPLDLNKKLNIAHINVCTEAEGPYRRMAIWFQGCNIMCDGCCNVELQKIKVAHIMTVSEVLNIAIRSKKKYGIEGVTFLGGEPTLQENLYHLAGALALADIGTILFTGKLFKDIESRLVNVIDLIVDGKFESKQLDVKRNLIGSTNQQIIYVTDRYEGSKDWFMSSREKRVEINLKDYLFINGDVI